MRLLSIAALAVLAAAPPAAAPPSTSWPPPRTSPTSPARWGATASRSRRSPAATRTRTSSRRSPASSSSCAKADLLVAVGRELGDRLAAPARPAEPQREDPAGGRRLPRRLAHRPDPRDPDRPDHARHGRRAPPRQPALLARPRQRPAHREGDRGQALAHGPRGRGVLRRPLRRLRPAPRRGREALGRPDGPLPGPEGRHLPPLLAQLRRPLRPRRDRLRRAPARASRPRPATPSTSSPR